MASKISASKAAASRGPTVGSSETASAYRLHCIAPFFLKGQSFFPLCRLHSFDVSPSVRISRKFYDAESSCIDQTTPQGSVLTSHSFQVHSLPVVSTHNLYQYLVTCVAQIHTICTFTLLIRGLCAAHPPFFKLNALLFIRLSYGAVAWAACTLCLAAKSLI